VSTPRKRRAGELADALARAVDAGILDGAQARAVLDAEHAHGAASGGGRRVLVTEALGYLGALLALSGAVMLATQYWREVPVAGRLGLLAAVAAVAAVTWLVGIRIGDGSAPALIRLRGAVGWMAVLPPPVLALAGGGVAVLAGVGITAGDWPDAAPLLGLATATVFVVVGIGTNRTALTVVGLAGGFGYLPWTVGHFFAGSLGVPLAILLCGIALLAVTLAVLRRPSGGVSAR
jgi:hypothetical protein